MPSKIQISADQVSALVALLPASSLGMGSGFVFDGANLTVPDAAVAQVNAILASPNWGTQAAAAQLVAYAASVRYAKETGGIKVSGLSVDTSRASQAQVSGAAAMALSNPALTLQWKAADGSWAALTAPAIIGLANAVAAHVQACFAAEAALAAQIASGAVTTQAQIDAVFAAIIA